MIISFTHQHKIYHADLTKGIDISIPIQNGFENPNCFWSPMPSFEPVRAGDFIGDTQQGGVVNFKNIRINPHGNGTHTECVGHIAKEIYTINKCLKEFHFFAKLVSIFPQKMDNGDRVVTQSQLMEVLEKDSCKAFIIRTMPNDDFKKTSNYSGANPPYLHHEAVSYLVDCGVEHLLVDLPSVDRSEDEGKLLAHKAFWLYPENVRSHCSISELIYVPNEVKDGFFLLNIQIASFEMDASPSKILLFDVS